MGEQWRQLAPESLNVSKVWIEANAGKWLWDPVILAILSAPTWVVFGILGVFLYWLGQKRKEVEVFIN
jgi:hypothetical protein